MNDKFANCLKYANEDIETILQRIEPRLRTSLSVTKDPKIEQTEIDDDNYEECLHVKYTYDVDADGQPATATIAYDICDGDVFYPEGKSLHDLEESVYDQLHAVIKENKIQSATVLHTQKISAADEDVDFDDIVEDDDDGVSDAIDDVSDQIDDLQDQVDEIDEDNIDIEVENNISDHYIAECDACHGVFISAMIESDENVEFISGTCPLCGKESDQFLKWIVRTVDKQ